MKKSEVREGIGFGRDSSIMSFSFDLQRFADYYVTEVDGEGWRW